ncbi:MAG: hemerythrin domain-containing protein [Verrucomicrobiota bacterium]|nr:hemerythrin domain-containing protein [Limisphaera sp.]MDW8381114.1 hemerythrin domain-containing protein [Verrucomicrobiota bacterium]
MKITDILLAEHVVFHNIFDHIEKALPQLKSLAEVRALAALLEDLLQGHSRTEDDLLLAPLEHCLEQIGQRDTFEHEHQEVDINLQRVRKARTLPEARRLLQHAVTYSRKHFDHEERILFPMAEKVLKTTTLRQLGQAWLKRRDAIPTGALGTTPD